MEVPRAPPSPLRPPQPPPPPPPQQQRPLTHPRLMSGAISTHDPSHPPPQPPARVSAPYGHACANCARAKCKCVSRAGAGSSPGNKCERCHRLGRECTPSPTVRKRGSNRRAGRLGSKGSSNDGAVTGHSSGGASARTPSSVTAHLEEKLDDLVTLLKQQAAAAAGSSPAAASTTTTSAASTRNTAALDLSVGAGFCGGNGGASTSGPGTAAPVAATTTGTTTTTTTAPPPHQIPTPESTAGSSSHHNDESGEPRLRLRDMHPFAQLAGTGGPNHVAPSACLPPAPGAAAPPMPPDLDPAAAAECLRSFRANHLRFFPFVYIPPEMTADQLRRERPFLWLNIRSLCCKSALAQAAIGHRIRETIGQQVLGQSERSMDLLLGIIGFLGWGMVQAMGKPFMAVFTGLAAGLVSDLRLDKPPHFNPLKDAHAFKPYRFACPSAAAAASTSNERTHEQRRAVLACWVISVSNFYFLKTQSMRWTPHMEESLRKLADEPEWPGDELLAALVRVFKVVDDLSHLQWSVAEFGGRSAAPKPVPMHYLKGLRANLDEVRRSLPPSLQDNKVIQVYLHSAEAQINDLPLQTPAPPPQPGFVDMSRTECFEACLRACKLTLETFLSFEPAEYVGFPMPMFLHYSRGTQVLYRLSLTDDPAWDRAAVRGAVDLVGALGEGAARFAAVARAAGLRSDGPDDGDMFTKGANALRATIPIWRASLEHVGAIPPSHSSGADNNNNNNNNPTPIPAAEAVAAATPGIGSAEIPAGMNGGGGNHAEATAADGMSMVDGTGVSEANGGMAADMQGGELPSLQFDAMQDFMVMDFVDDPWIQDFFTWESPRR